MRPLEGALPRAGYGLAAGFVAVLATSRVRAVASQVSFRFANRCEAAECRALKQQTRGFDRQRLAQVNAARKRSLGNHAASPVIVTHFAVPTH